MLSDVVIKQLKQFDDERGKLMHMVKSTDDVFEKFGEIYFSVCNPGFIKAWKLHKKKTSLYCVIVGTAKIVLYDMRKSSKTCGSFQEVEAGENNYILVKIPPGIAHGFTCAGEKSCMVANLTTEPYDQSDNFDISYKNGEIKYNW